MMKKKGSLFKGAAAVTAGSAAAAASTAGSNMMSMGDDVAMDSQDDDVVAVIRHEGIARPVHRTADVVAVENDSTIDVSNPQDIDTPMPNDITQQDMPLMADNLDAPDPIDGGVSLTADITVDSNAMPDATDAV
ncbi:MAG: hypothetical protein IJ527_06875 [Prevotella sp.]|nr:hypothetical protein [Prevotella sp.]